MMKIIGIILLLIVVGFLALFLIPPKDSLYGIPDGFVEKKVVVNDVSLNYVEGPDNGVPLLLIPGQSESWNGYKLVMSELAKRAHVYIVEVRGQGKSDWTPGRYSYNQFGQDLKSFLEQVIGEPAVVSGLSSGGVITIWLAANAQEMVLGIVPEDPPIFSSIWPRIREEKYMTYIFQHGIRVMEDPNGFSVSRYYQGMGLPQEGKPELLLIPKMVADGIELLYKIKAFLVPSKKLDVPLLSYEMRTGVQFAQSVDTDFGRSTIDGRLSAGFDPEETLARISVPTLLLRAEAKVDPQWNLIGAMSDDDVAMFRHLVPHADVAELTSSHSIHTSHPQWFLEQMNRFLDEMEKGSGF